MILSGLGASFDSFKASIYLGQRQPTIRQALRNSVLSSSKSCWQYFVLCWIPCRSFFTACLQKLPGKFPRRWGGYFRSDADHRDFTAIGTAAGKTCITFPSVFQSVVRVCPFCVQLTLNDKFLQGIIAILQLQWQPCGGDLHERLFWILLQ